MEWNGVKWMIGRDDKFGRRAGFGMRRNVWCWCAPDVQGGGGGMP